MRPLLVYNGYATGGARAYSLGLNSYTQLGDVIASADTGTEKEHGIKGQNICQVENTIYVVSDGALKRKNEDGSWSTVQSLSNPYTTIDIWRMGTCVISGVTYIVIFYISSGSASNSTKCRAGIYNANTDSYSTSSEVDIVGLHPNNFSVSEMHFYGNTGYLLASSQGNYRLLSINVEGNSVSSTTLSDLWGDGLRASLCVFQNELWLLATNGTSTSAAFVLYKLIGTSFISQYTVATLTVPSNTYHWKPLLFTDGEYMYAICASEASSAMTWKMYKCTTSAASDITSSVINGFSGLDRNGRWRWVCDQHSEPTNPEIILIYQPTTTTGAVNSFYLFTDDSTQLRFLGSAGEAGKVAAIATPHMGGGELQYREGEMHIAFWGEPAPSVTPGNITMYFRIYEGSVFPSGSPVHVKMFASNERNTPKTPCRLSNPRPFGSILNSYTITGIECGSGTLYSVDWRAAADGFSVGDSVTMVASVSGVI